LPANQEILEYMRKVLDQWINETADNIPENFTPDRQTVSGERFDDFERGEMPGETSGGTICMDPGPILLTDIEL